MKKMLTWGLAVLAVAGLIQGCGSGNPAAQSASGYSPQQSPLPGKTGKPLAQWGVDMGETIVSHTFSVFSDPIYPPDFTHFDYVNPQAPQGGTLRLGVLGTFDTFHRYGQRGDFHASMSGFYDTLMAASADEVDALYPLIAQKIEYAKDFSYVIFHIDPRARFQDGKPITAADVVFSFEKFKTQGVPQFASYYAPVKKVQAVEPLKVRFDLSEPDQEMISSLAGLTIIPPQFWKDRDFSQPLKEPPLGSGSMVIEDYKMGQYLVYKSKEDYWAKDLPVNKGSGNFARYRYDFYKDENVLLEAFKAGEYDFRIENTAKNWATQYAGPLFDNGAIIKAPFDHQTPPGTQSFVFNTTRPVFKDYRVRRALSYAMDFEWMNKNLFYGQYKRLRSFFQATNYEAFGTPSVQEVAVLEKIRDKIPPEVFTQEYQPPVTDGTGSIRTGMTAALELFKQAGWVLKDGVLKNNITGEPLVFELMSDSPTDERVALPLQENLKKMGVTMKITQVDTTQWIERLRDGDFDFVLSSYAAFNYPDSNLFFYWHSKYIDSSYNTARVTDPALDYLVDGIVSALKAQDKEALLTWGRAFDRVIQWSSYYIPQWYLSTYRIAHQDKFGKPQVWPKYGAGSAAWVYWWMDKEKESALQGKKSP